MTKSSLDMDAAELTPEGSGAWTPRKMMLTTDQFAALRAFADANGRTWKSALRVAWSTGRYQDYNGTNAYGDLQRVRNVFGASWLMTFSFAKIASHSTTR
jgi:hypothetical protein